MKSGSLTLVPTGGLANRMRCIASAYCLCKQSNTILNVIWFRDKGLNARFCDIFYPINEIGISIRESRSFDFIINDRPRRHNLFIPRFSQKLLYGDNRIYETDVDRLNAEKFNFSSWIQKGKCYMSSWSEFGKVPTTIYSQMFMPVQEVEKRVLEIVSNFALNTVGLHIRRTDHIHSIRNSPTELFIRAAEREIENDHTLKIFLATDDSMVKRQLCSIFGDRVITAEETLGRDTLPGIMAALVDMWALSNTRMIYGSMHSSFSEMASRLGNIELKVLRIE